MTSGCEIIRETVMSSFANDDSKFGNWEILRNGACGRGRDFTISSGLLAKTPMKTEDSVELSKSSSTVNQTESIRK